MSTHTPEQVQAKELQDGLAGTRSAIAHMRCLLEKAPFEIVAEFSNTNTMYKIQVIPVWTNEDKTERLVLFRSNRGSRLGILLWDKSVCLSNNARAITLEVLQWDISYTIFHAADKPEFLKEIVESTVVVCNKEDIRMVFLLGAYEYDFGVFVKNTDTVFLEIGTFSGFSRQYDTSDYWTECINKQNSRILEWPPQKIL